MYSSHAAYPTCYQNNYPIQDWQKRGCAFSILEILADLSFEIQVTFISNKGQQFDIIINKAQKQSLKNYGINLTSP